MTVYLLICANERERASATKRLDITLFTHSNNTSNAPMVVFPTKPNLGIHEET